MGKIDILRLLKNHAYPIGVDVGGDTLKLVQLGLTPEVGAGNGKCVSLIAGSSETLPVGVESGSGNWQRWAIEAMRGLTSNGSFHGRDVIAAMPAGEVFIDHIKMLRADDNNLEDVVLSKIKQKLPFDSANAVVKCIPAEQDNVLVMVAEREKINRHLAIYEKAQLAIKSIGVWPVALTNSYTRFFGRRKTDIEAVVVLLDMEANCTNVVICRHRNPLFARSIPIGAKQLDSDEMITKLVLELTGCRRQFGLMYKKLQPERLLFLSGRADDKDVCTRIAKQLEMPAQRGDCLAAVEIPASWDDSGIDRRQCQVNWATAFGLSLQCEG